MWRHEFVLTWQTGTFKIKTSGLLGLTPVNMFVRAEVLTQSLIDIKGLEKPLFTILSK
jgi:hypothetical protein